MAARQISTESVARTLLAVGDDIQANFDATAKKAEITEAGRLVRSMADLLNTKPTVEYHQDERAKKASWLTSIKNVVDSALEWLEHCGQVDAQKLEQVLRGLYNLTGTKCYVIIVSKTFQDFSQVIEKYERSIF